MGTKRRAVVNAEADHLRRIEALVSGGRYKTLSDFVREAVDVDEVARYCAAGHANEDDDLVGTQAIASEQPSRTRPRTGLELPVR